MALKLIRSTRRTAARWTAPSSGAAARAADDAFGCIRRQNGCNGGTASVRHPDVAFGQRGLKRARMRNLIQLRVLQPLLERIIVVEAMQHRRHPPGKMLGGPYTFERDGRILFEPIARPERIKLCQ